MGATLVFVTRPEDVITPEQVKKNFDEEGLSFARWGRENGYRPNDVYMVTNGLCKAKFGKKHEIAVLLRLKAGTVRKSNNDYGGQILHIPKMQKVKSNAKP